MTILIYLEGEVWREAPRSHVCWFFGGTVCFDCPFTKPPLVTVAIETMGVQFHTEVKKTLHVTFLADDCGFCKVLQANVQ